jgi:hypothetical protein
LGLFVSGCAAKARLEVAPASAANTAFIGLDTIGELKDFAEGLGGHATENFRRHSDRRIADNRCYFTGKLELPEFYSTLKMVREDGDRCAARGADHDVFFYPVEAVASGEETITVSLSEAPTERVLVVVPHEDFHNQRELRTAPTEVAEAAATLVGFLTASAFAKDKFGAESPMFRNLDRDAELFLRKAGIVNRYYGEVSAVYEGYLRRTLTAAQALSRKALLFAELQHLFGDRAGPGVVQQMSRRDEQRRAGFDHAIAALSDDPRALQAARRGHLSWWPG